MRYVTPLRVCLIRAAALSLLPVLVCAAGFAETGPTVAEELRLELELELARDLRDLPALERMYQEPRAGGRVRGRALFAVATEVGFGTTEARTRLSAALRDPDAGVRVAAVRAVAETSQRLLEREVLRVAAEDPDAGARVQAMRAVRRWTRQGHLYFLEQALISPWPSVQAEAISNLAELEYRELPPEIIDRVNTLALAPASPRVRRRALTALQRWERLSWETAREVVADSSVPDAVRVHVLELSGSLQGAGGREAFLLELLETAPSLPLAWAAFRELPKGTHVAVPLAEALRRYLLGTPERNAATEAMAVYVRRHGYRVDYRAGEWQIRR